MTTTELPIPLPARSLDHGGPHAYPVDLTAYAAGITHQRENRYSTAASTGAAWIYWHGQGWAAATLTD